MEITPAEHAETAAQAIRNLNHTTISPGDRWTYPADAADVIGSLAHLARILPQAIEQATALVGWAADEDRLVHDSSIDLVDTHLVRVGACERDARSAAEALATALDALHEVLVPLGYQLAGEPVDD